MVKTMPLWYWVPVACPISRTVAGREFVAWYCSMYSKMARWRAVSSGLWIDLAAAVAIDASTKNMQKFGWIGWVWMANEPDRGPVGSGVASSIIPENLLETAM